MAKIVTVIDIGSNSVGMVVYEKTSRFSFKKLHEAKSKVRISQNAYSNNNYLQEEPMQRAFNTLEAFLSISNSFKAKKILCVATSALRDAPNKKEFIQKVKNKLKLNIKIIDGKKEAYYGAIACRNLLPSLEQKSLTVDIGGGSTEFGVIDTQGEIQETFSLSLGTVRIKELFCDFQEREKAIQYIDNQLDEMMPSNTQQLIGIGGTLRAISQAIMTQTQYSYQKLHAYSYTQEELESMIQQILAADEAKLKNLGIKENRLDVIKSGALILQRIVNKLSLNEIITSKVGVKEGVYLHDMLRNSKGKFPVNYNVSLRKMIDCYSIEQTHDNQLKKVVSELFTLTAQTYTIDLSYKPYLSMSAKISSFTKEAQHYLQELEYQLSHKETLLISAIINNSNSFLVKYKPLLPKKEVIEYLRFLLKIGETLLLHRPRSVDFSMTFKDNTLSIKSRNSLYLSKEIINKISVDSFFKIQFSS